MIIFRCDDDKTVSTDHGITPIWKRILDFGTVAIIRKSEIARVKQDRFQVIALLHYLQQPVSHTLALAFFAISSKKDWDMKLFHLMSLDCHLAPFVFHRISSTH